MRKINKVLSLCSRMLKIGKDRVKFDVTKMPEDFKLDFSRNVVRDYLKSKLIYVRPFKGTTRHVTSLPSAKIGKKTIWISQVRRLRKYLKQLKTQLNLNNLQYRFVYLKIKSNIVSTRKQVYNLSKNVLKKKI